LLDSFVLEDLILANVILGAQRCNVGLDGYRHFSRPFIELPGIVPGTGF
jgi:hypothetical protein